MKRLLTLALLTLALLAMSLTGCSTYSRVLTSVNRATGSDPASNIGPMAQRLIAEGKADLERTGEMAAAAGGEPVGMRCSADGLAAIANLPTDVGQPNGLLSGAYLLRLWRMAIESPLVQKAKDSCSPLVAEGKQFFFETIKGLIGR